MISGIEIAAYLVFAMVLTPHVKELQLVNKSNVTSDGNGGEFDVSAYEDVELRLDVTKANGTTPTLDVKVQTWDPGEQAWIDEGTSFTQVTGSTTSEEKSISGTNRSRLRIKWTTGGTNPDYDFTVGAVVSKDKAAV